VVVQFGLVRAASWLLCGLALLAVTATPADAQSQRAPGQNSGLTEYMEAVPSATGNRSPAGGDPRAAGVDARTRRALASRSTAGQNLLRLAGAPDYASRDGAKAAGARTAGTRPGRATTRRRGSAPGASDRSRPQRPDSSSGAVATSLGGGGAGLGLALPIILVLTPAAMVAVWFVQRRPGA
jgi:hypothetical protein